jgi:hypothetical protein
VGTVGVGVIGIWVCNQRKLGDGEYFGIILGNCFMGITIT